MKPEKTLQWSVFQNNESQVVQLKGELTRATLRPLWEQRASFLQTNANLAELYGLSDWIKQYIPNENQNVINA